MDNLEIKKRGWQVPNYKVTSLQNKKNDYCVCIFVINEGKKIQTQLETMKSLSASIDIIVADGGSTDDSLQLNFLEKAGVNTLLTKTGEGKLSAQMRMAFAYSLIRGYKGIVIIDGNGKDDIHTIPNFVEYLEKGYDHIQGSRFIRGGKSINLPWSRWFGIRFIHAPLISIFARFYYTDTTNGFRAYSQKLLLDEKVAPFRKVFSAYELHYYLSIRAARLGYNVIEIPVIRKYPEKGPIPTKISPLKGNILVLKTLFCTCLGFYNP